MNKSIFLLLFIYLFICNSLLFGRDYYLRTNIITNRRDIEIISPKPNICIELSTIKFKWVEVTNAVRYIVEFGTVDSTRIYNNPFSENLEFTEPKSIDKNGERIYYNIEFSINIAATNFKYLEFPMNIKFSTSRVLYWQVSAYDLNNEIIAISDIIKFKNKIH